MQQRIDNLSDWIRGQEEITPVLDDFAEEVHQTVLETDFLLQASDQIQSAYVALLGKLHDDS